MRLAMKNSTFLSLVKKLRPFALQSFSEQEFITLILLLVIAGTVYIPSRIPSLFSLIISSPVSDKTITLLIFGAFIGLYCGYYVKCAIKLAISNIVPTMREKRILAEGYFMTLILISFTATAMNVGQKLSVGFFDFLTTLIVISILIRSLVGFLIINAGAMFREYTPSHHDDILADLFRDNQVTISDLIIIVIGTPIVLVWLIRNESSAPIAISLTFFYITSIISVYKAVVRHK